MGRRFLNKKVLSVSLDAEVHQYILDMAEKAHLPVSSFVNMWFLTAMVDLDEDDEPEITPAQVLVKKLF